jgi:outer membrane protein insertion porin family
MKKSIAIKLLNMRSLFLGLFAFILGLNVASAQILGGTRSLSSPLEETSFSYADPKEYTIADIQVTGSQFYDGTSMINISGLQIGDRIKVPGDAIGAAIRKIMNQGILDEVLIYANKVEDGKIWLTIELKER